MPPRLDAVDHRERAVSEQEARLSRQRSLLAECLAEHAPSMLRPGALEALARGDLMDFRRGVRRPKPAALIDCLRKFAQSGWTAGLLDAERTVEELLPGVNKERIAQRVVDAMPNVRRFDERDVGRLARIRRRRARRNQIADRPPPPDLPASSREDRIIAEESRRMAGGLRRLLKSMLENAAKRDADAVKRQRALNDLVERIRRGDKKAETLLEKAGLDKSDAAGAAADIDWHHFQKGASEVYRRDKIIKGLEWVTRRDRVVTCVCQIFDGNVIALDDDELGETTPQIHYRCRCNRYPVTVDSKASLSWDFRRRIVLGQPDAGGDKITLFVAPRDIQIPGAAPNVAPPKDCRDWISPSRSSAHRRFTTKREMERETPKQETKLERAYIEQLRERGDEQVRRILRSAGIDPRTGEFLFAEVK